VRVVCVLAYKTLDYWQATLGREWRQQKNNVGLVVALGKAINCLEEELALLQKVLGIKAVATCITLCTRRLCESVSAFMCLVPRSPFSTSHR